MNFIGTIIEESLENKDILNNVKILSTKTEPATEEDKTPWLKQWTLHKVEIDKNNAKQLAEQISKSIDSKHSHSWYIDYKNDDWHYIIFPNKIFKIKRNDSSGYEEVEKYGIISGIPKHQLDFSPDIK